MADTQVEKLLPCRECGSQPRIEHFEGPHIAGQISLWVCSNHKRFGGDCPSDLAHFGELAWNAHQSTMTAQSPNAGLVERVAEIMRHTAGTDMEQAQQLIDAIAVSNGSRVERLAAALRPFAECELDYSWQPGEGGSRIHLKNLIPPAKREFDEAKAALAALAPPQADHALVEALVALADAADKCSEAPHFIVQPFLGVYRKHGETIANARAAHPSLRETSDAS